MKKYLNPYLTAQPEPLVHNENFPAHNISAQVIASPAITATRARRSHPPVFTFLPPHRSK